MAEGDSDLRSSVRYEANDKPPMPLTMGLGLQLAILMIAGIVLTPALVVRAAGGTESYLSWAVFAAVAVSGVATILQAARVGRVGAGYVLAMGTSGAFIAVSVTALAKGGPAMLATLVAVSALYQFALAWRLSLFRRVLTPAVSGTVIMLIAVTVMPIVAQLLTQVPEGVSASAAPLSALATILVIAGIALTARGAIRLWAPVIGVAAGSAVAGYYGLYDTDLVSQASWVGLPEGKWPGLDLSFGPVFWTLLPGFVFVTIVGAIETIGDSVAIQRVSWRRPGAVDYRSVQGAVTADGVGNLLSGLAGTMPNTTYSTSVAVTELTGVAARRVGIVLGAVFIVLAFLPKVLAVVLAIPGPVAAAYVTVLLSMLFVLGMKVVVQDGIDYRKGLIAGVSFWIGVSFQSGWIAPEYFAEFAGGLLNNGMTAGGLVAIVMTLFMELTRPRRRRTQVSCEIASLPDIREFVLDFARKSGFDSEMSGRLDSVSEETLLTLVNEGGDAEDDSVRGLLVIARKESEGAVLEFIAAPGEDNIQDRISLLGERIDHPHAERELSLRLLRHLASSVHHQQYNNLDIVTVRVDFGRTAGGS